MPESVARLRSAAMVVLLLSLAALLVGCGRGNRRPAGSIDTGMWKPCWSKDSKALYYGKPGSRYGTSEVWRYDLKTRKRSKCLSEIPRELGDIDISPDETSIVYCHTPDTGPTYCLEKLCLATGRISRVCESDDGLVGARWLPQNRITTWKRSGPNGALVTIDPDHVDKAKTSATVTPVYFGTDGHGLVSSNNGEMFSYYSLSGGQRMPLGVRDVSCVLYLSRRQMVYYNVHRQIISIDTRTLRKTSVNLPRARINTELSPNLRYYYYIPTSRGEWGPLPGLYVMEIPQSEREKLLRIERGEVARSPSGMAGKQ